MRGHGPWDLNHRSEFEYLILKTASQHVEMINDVLDEFFDE
jgi:hypothetical protein